jgi:hypothetical protein
MATGDAHRVRAHLQNALSSDNILVIHAHIKSALALTFRTTSGWPRASKRKALRVDAEIADSVTAFKTANPDWSLQEIADHYGLGCGGRVSEILTGQWERAQAEYDKVKEYT